jgi:hypothetical protein
MGKFIGGYGACIDKLPLNLNIPLAGQNGWNLFWGSKRLSKFIPSALDSEGFSVISMGKS